MSLINKEKVLNGVGKAVDATNKAAEYARTFQCFFTFLEFTSSNKGKE